MRGDGQREEHEGGKTKKKKQGELVSLLVKSTMIANTESPGSSTRNTAACARARVVCMLCGFLSRIQFDLFAACARM